MNAGLGSLVCAAAIAHGQSKVERREPENFGWMDIDQLSRIKITSVSRKPESISQAPAAIHVITTDDIHRSGATSLPEALRLAPGVDVARINSQRYAVSIRGFNGEFANKLLVLQDGRSLYTPQFSGTFWDSQDTFLEDVERIEVIRGPGGTAWGINAMNGVINVITRDARETQGTVVTGGAGSSERGFGGVRHGGKIGENTYYRVYAKAFYRDEMDLAGGGGTGDDWAQARLGFRLDSFSSEQDQFTVQGDFYGGEILQYSGGAPDSFTSYGENLLGRWTRSFSAESVMNLQVYYDAVQRDSLPATANTDTGDIELTHRFALGSRQQINWGAHYRYLVNEARGRVGHNYDPVHRALSYGGFFVEDEVAVIPEQLRFSAGTKLEYNDFSGWEVLPNGRVSYTPNDGQTFWAAVSRGLQMPSISSHDLTIDIPGALTIRSVPNKDRPSAEVIAYELGWRSRLAKSLTVDTAVFYNDYDKLETAEVVVTPSPATMTVSPSNRMFGESYGFESSVLWQATDWWRWRASYSLLLLQLHLYPGTTDTTSERAEGQSPQQQAQLWSSMNLGSKWTFDGVLRFVDRLPALSIEEYFGLDLRLAFHPTPNMEFALVGQNLIEEHHVEFRRSPGFPANTEIPRGIYGQFTFRF